MLERLRLEVGAERAVHHVEHVAVELGGDSRRIIIRGVEAGGVLDEIEADEQGITGGELGRQRAQEPRHVGRMQIADRAREEQREPPAARAERNEVFMEVAHDPAHGEARVVGRETIDRRGQKALADVQHDAALEQLPRLHRLQQPPHLAADPRPEFAQLGRSGALDDLVGDRLEERVLGSGLVVLGQPRDLVEERAAAVVVEVLAGQRWQRPGQQARPDLFGHPCQGPVGASGPLDADVSRRLDHPSRLRTGPQALPRDGAERHGLDRTPRRGPCQPGPPLWPGLARRADLARCGGMPYSGPASHHS